MSNQRDELMSRIMFAFSSVDDAYALERLADWIEGRYTPKPAVMTNAEELDALPNGSVVMDSEPRICEKRYGYWKLMDLAGVWDPDDLKFPATVLHRPSE